MLRTTSKKVGGNQGGPEIQILPDHYSEFISTTFPKHKIIIDKVKNIIAWIYGDHRMFQINLFQLS